MGFWTWPKLKTYFGPIQNNLNWSKIVWFGHSAWISVELIPLKLRSTHYGIGQISQGKTLHRVIISQLLVSYYSYFTLEMVQKVKFNTKNEFLDLAQIENLFWTYPKQFEFVQNCLIWSQCVDLSKIDPAQNEIHALWIWSNIPRENFAQSNHFSTFGILLR